MTINEIEKQSYHFEKDYLECKARIESNVIQWVWCKKQYFSAEPYFNQKNKKQPGKLLKKLPEDPTGYVCCGLDQHQQVIIEKEIQKFPDHGWDRLNIFENGVCIWELAFDKKGKIQYCRKNDWDGAKLIRYWHLHLFGSKNFSAEEYTYSDQRIVKSVFKKNFIMDKKESLYEFKYSYGPHGDLVGITADIEHSYATGYKDLIIYKQK